MFGNTHPDLNQEQLLEKFQQEYAGIRDNPNARESAWRTSLSPSEQRELAEMETAWDNRGQSQNGVKPAALLSSETQNQNAVRFVSPNYGTVSHRNILVDGHVNSQMGHSKQHSRFEISELADNTFAVTHHQRVEYFVGVEKVSDKDLGQDEPSRFFPAYQAALTFVHDNIAEYNQVAAEESAYAADYQQQQDFESVYGDDDDDEIEEDQEEESSYTQEPSSATYVAKALTDKLDTIALDIRTQWEHHLTVEPHAQDAINADFQGRVSVYNDVVLVLHDLHNSGRLAVSGLPELLHPEGLERAASSAAQYRLDGREAIDSRARLLEQAGDFRELLNSNEAEIRGEWQADYENGMLNRHDVDTYFAGQVDHHNSMTDKVVLAHPELPTAAIQRIDYEVTRAEVRQHITAKEVQEAAKITPNSYSIGMEI